MRVELQYIEYAMVYIIALVIAIALMAASGPARSAHLEPQADPYLPPHMEQPAAPKRPRAKGPRWSNEHHYEAARAVRQNDCLYGPEYKSGVDAWGDPVIPADLPRRRAQGLPLGVDADIQLPPRTIGKNPVDLSAGDIYYDLTNRELSINGVPWVKDCIPPTK